MITNQRDNKNQIVEIDVDEVIKIKVPKNSSEEYLQKLAVKICILNGKDIDKIYEMIKQKLLF